VICDLRFAEWDIPPTHVYGTKDLKVISTIENNVKTAA